MNRNRQGAQAEHRAISWLLANTDAVRAARTSGSHGDFDVVAQTGEETWYIGCRSGKRPWHTPSERKGILEWACGGGRDGRAYEYLEQCNGPGKPRVVTWREIEP
jgi:hypothetical protein